MQVSPMIAQVRGRPCERWVTTPAKWIASMGSLFKAYEVIFELLSTLRIFGLGLPDIMTVAHIAPRAAKLSRAHMS